MTTMTDTTIDLTADVIDVRDIIARIEHLEPIRTAGPVDLGDDNDTDQDSLFSELDALESIMADLKGMGGDEQWRGDWYPLTLISDYYFEEYARELAEDISGPELREAAWPFSYIDWGAAADALRQDYSSVEVDGRTYWTR